MNTPTPSGPSKSQADASASLVALLRDPGNYEQPNESVELIETHISWVFLTDRFVYKLKKPVRFEFLDFSQVEQRERACRDELRLNSRLSPDIYLDVLPITQESDGSLRLNGAGRPVDWVVKMKRLPASQAMDRLIRDGKLEPAQVDALAAVLGAFYEQSQSMHVPDSEYLQAIDEHIRGNLAELLRPDYPLDFRLVRLVHGAQLRFLCLERQALVDRIAAGRIVDGHGDLRPEHVYFHPAPRIIDCIEFSAEFRRLDVADELAFLAMECDRLGAAWIGERVLKSYGDRSRDRLEAPLVAFFKAYRACVRCKVSALRWRQVGGASSDGLLADCRRYLELAAGYASRLGPPALVVVRGLSGTGKSTVAAALSRAWECRHLQTDVLRRETAPARSETGGFNEGRYSAVARRGVYGRMFELAEIELRQGLSVILDGTFLAADLRDEAIRIAHRHAAQPLLVRCDCPLDVAMARIERRRRTGGSVSEVKPEFVPRQHEEEQPDRADWPVCEVDTSRKATAAVPTICQALRRHLRLLSNPAD